MSETPLFTPSLTLTGQSGNVKVVRKLYGPVSQERAAKEQLDVQRRALMLDPTKFERPREPVYVPVDRDEDEYAESRPEWKAKQTGGRRR